jgi:ParB/RepB/Spo0J family partition protein
MPIIRNIPVTRIRPCLGNPRKAIRPGSVEAMMESLRSGQENDIKVRPLTSEEKQADPDHDYELIGGHLRLAAAQRLGWETLRAEVLNLTAKEALRAAILDNVRTDLYWLARYESLETLMANDSQTTQEEAGKLVLMDQALVSKALKLLSLLNQPARARIYELFIKPDSKELAQTTALRLLGLATGKPSDPDLVEKTLGVVLDRQLEDSQVAQLVEWVKLGNSPESFQEAGEEESKTSKSTRFDPEDPNADLWQACPRTVRVAPAGEDNYRIAIKVPRWQGPVAVYSALAALEDLKGQAGQRNDAQFGQALPGLVAEALKDWGVQKQAQTQDESAKRQARRVQAREKAKAQPGAPAPISASEVSASPSQPASIPSEVVLRAIQTYLEPQIGQGPVDAILQTFRGGNKDQGMRLITEGLAKTALPATQQQDMIGNIDHILTSKPSDPARQSGAAKAPETPMSPQTVMTPKPQGALGQVEAVIQENLKKVTPGGVAEGLAKDAKQALNYQIRRVFRKGIGKLFS